MANKLTMATDTIKLYEDRGMPNTYANFNTESLFQHKQILQAL